MKFDTLYKKTSTGKVQSWRIWVEKNTIFSESGQVGGKLVRTSDTVKSGKSKGTSKETTPEQQALAEARSKWTKQLKKGYVRAIEDAESGKVDEVIQGGVVPMLAKKFHEDKKHIKYPCAVQPKLDGMRAIYQGGKLWSRTRKPILAVPHILAELTKYGVEYTLDGELYNHELQEDFESIISAARRDKHLSEESAQIQYHVYDVVIDLPFRAREALLTKIFRKVPVGSCIKMVPTVLANDETVLAERHEQFLEHGYEGAMVRNLDAPYENKRSNHLQKLKSFEDAEFKVVGIEEGRGKLQGHVGAFICEINDKFGRREFRAKAEGKQSFLKDCFKDHEIWKGKMLTVRFFGYTGANRVPRFPVGVRFREEV